MSDILLFYFVSELAFCWLPYLKHLISHEQFMISSWSVHESSAALRWHIGQVGFFWQGSSVSLKWVGCLITVPKDGKGRCCDPWGMQVKGKFHKWRRRWMPSSLVYVQWSTICSSLIPADYLQLWTTWFLMLHISSPADMSSSYPERKILKFFFIARNNNLDFFIFPFKSNIDVDLQCKSTLVCCKLKPELH